MDNDVLDVVLRGCSKVIFNGDAGDLPSSSLDTETVEVFTLEKFKNLIVSHMKEGRDFIIAEVTTRDPLTESVFRSYYSAIELNRILFCVEGNNNFLYRVSAKNPINNLRITGKVFYYKITPEALSSIAKPRHLGERTCSNEVVIKAEYFANDEDLLFDPSIRRYFAKNLVEEGYFIHRLEQMESPVVISEDLLENYHDDKFGLKIILYTNIGTILVIFGMCILLGSKEAFVVAMAPLSMTLLFSILFLILYVLLFESPEGFSSIFNFRKNRFS
ncbi:hypothetical protein EHEL_080760 [Encephalitozoon hellem ATCC 50504]|uniref:DUF5092 domain-containing protein n=1 Tax=Encephalitozoon hellem TaxID=27973 RepID=A0A9Q9C4X8_ENCHE|nr:uncharacterized protein EHEL_080760 [Encephalitozoon hellem ATCC 50504]AFM98778.1 hypothetical protein EHEL_080760 [Encephalitozoon hellem ATCC 50504]UTX43755.1 DUF5092 domain-containing protein [Encephalitozoon hellem]WEL39233.1 DUF5092 domain-containing protein [Encephalitozoon hellem]|eukprot:XP_003887759.1 hypothetical protein EHEL_080760 [Encephalitozoon hellem ATCC 50504]